MAAIAAARAGCRVVLCERQAASGRKLLASGGGRCNLTNTVPRNQFARAFGSEKAALVTACLKQFGQQEIIRFFDTRGIPLAAEDGLHYFPTSQRAADILAVLIKLVDECRIPVLYGIDIHEIIIENGCFSGIRHSNGSIRAAQGILATGGMGYPQLGGTASGFECAAKAGHTVIEPVTGLVALVTEEKWPGQCAGVTLDWARLRIAGAPDSCLRQRTEGALLFTHRGISGPAAIDISGSVARLLLREKPVQLHCVLQKETDNARWMKRFEGWQREPGGKFLGSRLAEHLPQCLVTELLTLCNCPSPLRCADVSRALKINIITQLIQGINLHICDTEGWSRAMVTSGGIAVDQVDKTTMQSTRVAGLFFAGEVVDCDGPCGGYNLTWAFSSGWVAGTAAAKRIMEGKK